MLLKITITVENVRKPTNELKNNSSTVCTLHVQLTLFLSETNYSFPSFGTNNELAKLTSHKFIKQ